MFGCVKEYVDVILFVFFLWHPRGGRPLLEAQKAQKRTKRATVVQLGGGKRHVQQRVFPSIHLWPVNDQME
jgi:hypothetical protein